MINTINVEKIVDKELFIVSTKKDRYKSLFIKINNRLFNDAYNISNFNKGKNIMNILITFVMCEIMYFAR